MCLFNLALMIDLKVFLFLAVLGWAVRKMIEVECLTVTCVFIWGGRVCVGEDTFRTKPKTNNKTRETCLEGDFVPSACQSASFPMWNKLVEQSAGPAGFLRDQGKIYTEWFAARRIGTREPFVRRGLKLWERQHVWFAWMTLVQLRALLQTSTARQGTEMWGGCCTASSDGASSDVCRSHLPAHHWSKAESSVASALAPVSHWAV